MSDSIGDVNLPDPPNLSDELVRRRLWPEALRVFTESWAKKTCQTHMDAWQVAPADMRLLLALQPEAIVKEMDSERLTEEQLPRIS